MGKLYAGPGEKASGGVGLQTFNGKAVVLFVDGRVELLRIDRAGRALLDGKDLFDPSRPFWRGKKPDLRHPAR
jgi:prepilin-type processing-associated H-X9-DG protein